MSRGITIRMQSNKNSKITRILLQAYYLDDKVEAKRAGRQANSHGPAVWRFWTGLMPRNALNSRLTVWCSFPALQPHTFFASHCTTQLSSHPVRSLTHYRFRPIRSSDWQSAICTIRLVPGNLTLVSHPFVHPSITSSRRASRAQPEPPSSGREACPRNNSCCICGRFLNELRLIGTPNLARYKFLPTAPQGKTRQLGVCNPSPHTSSIILSC